MLPGIHCTEESTSAVGQDNGLWSGRAGQERVVTWAGEQERLYLETHTAGDRREGLNASCHTQPGAFTTSSCSKDLKEQTWALQEALWLLNPLTFIYNPVFRPHGQGLHQKS